jgi:hypothetical protein
MTSVAVPDTVKRPVPSTAPSSLLRAARWLIPDRRDGIVALALLLGVWLSNTFGILSLVDGPQPTAAAAFAIENLASTMAWFGAAALVARWAVSWTFAGWKYSLLLALTMVAALGLAAGGQIALARWRSSPLDLEYASTVGLGNANPAVPVSIAALWLPLGLLLAAQFQRSARERSARTRLDALLREQRLAQRRFAEARLQQIQSRIDPELLFEMLDHVRRLYRTDAIRAERLLDELIVFLRAVLPQLQSAASTLGREVRIAASYLRLRELAEDRAVAIDLTLPAELAAAPFPPGLMLPLVDAMRRRAGVIQITAEASDSGNRVILAAAAAPDEATLGRLRATLDDLYGSRYRLELARLAQWTTLTLTLPDEDRRD